MTVSIDKFWIEAVLAEAHPRFREQGGADLDRNGAIKGDEVFGDLDQDGTIGDRDDYKEYLRRNRASLSQEAPFFKWGERLSVENRIHQAIYLSSDLHSDSQIRGAYTFIADLVQRAGEDLGHEKLTPKREAQGYYRLMEGAGVLFKNQDDFSLIGNIDLRQLDCNTSGFVAMAIGDERDLTLQPVRAPEHLFLRGTNEEGTEFNVDFGELTTDESYGVAPDLVKKGVYLQALDNHKLEASFLIMRGDILSEPKHGRHEEALASYDRAIAIDPNNTAAHTNRGFVLEKLGRYEEALASCDRAIAIDPNDAMAHRNRSVSLSKLGRHEEASLSFYNMLIAMDPNFALVHKDRGSVLLGLGRYQEALEAFERALRLDPDLQGAEATLALLRLLTLRIDPIPGGLF